MSDYPRNDEVLAGYDDSLEFLNDLDHFYSEIGQNLARLNRDTLTTAEAREVNSALAQNQRQLKLAEIYVRVLTRNPVNARGFIERSKQTARQFSEFLDVPLIEATRRDAENFAGDRIALDVLFTYLTAERRRLGVKKRRKAIIDI
jgi:hypothetical protein